MQSKGGGVNTFLPELESLRGIAALFVALYHITWQTHLYRWTLARNASLMVDLFFVLSGFVICHAYGSRLTSSTALKQFVRARLARLYPLHLACLLGFLAIECLKWTALHAGIRIASQPFAINNAPSFIANLFLVQALGIFDRMTWNIPSWSISTEFYVYLLFAILPLARILLPGSITLAAAAIAACWYTMGSLTGNFQFFFFRCMAGFFSGVVLWHIYRLDTSRRFGPVPQAVILLATAAFLSASPQGPAEFAAIPIFMLLIFIAARSSSNGFLSSPALVYLGTISYSIYMIHSLIIWFFEFALQYGLRLPREQFYPTGFWAGDAITALYLVFVVGISGVTYRTIEIPCRIRLNRAKAA